MKCGSPISTWCFSNIVAPLKQPKYGLGEQLVKRKQVSYEIQHAQGWMRRMETGILNWRIQIEDISHMLYSFWVPQQELCNSKFRKRMRPKKSFLSRIFGEKETKEKGKKHIHSINAQSARYRARCGVPALRSSESVELKQGARRRPKTN